MSCSEADLGCRTVALFLQKTLNATPGLLGKCSGGSNNSEALTSRNDNVIQITHTHTHTDWWPGVHLLADMLLFHATLWQPFHNQSHIQTFQLLECVNERKGATPYLLIQHLQNLETETARGLPKVMVLTGLKSDSGAIPNLKGVH